MRTTPRPAAIASPGPFPTQLQLLILMLILLSFGCLFARTQAYNAPRAAIAHLRSSWFDTLPGSGDAITSAGLRCTELPVADQPSLMAHARAMHCRQSLAGS